MKPLTDWQFDEIFEFIHLITNGEYVITSGDIWYEAMKEWLKE